MPFLLEPPSAAALTLGGMACVTDVRTRRIPNWLTFGGACAGLMYRGFHGWSALGVGLVGLVLGLAVFLPFFLLRGMGAGDVKLMAALGAWLGANDALRAALFAMIAGGVLAVLLAIAHGRLRRVGHNLGVMFLRWRTHGVGPLAGLTLDDAPGPRLPYAVPITAGVLVQAWLG